MSEKEKEYMNEVCLSTFQFVRSLDVTDGKKLVILEKFFYLILDAFSDHDVKEN